MDTVFTGPSDAACPQTAQRPLRGAHNAGPAASELVLSTMRDLPALPAAVFELLHLVRLDHVNTRTLATKLSYDQALTAKILRLANSSFYGVPRGVTSVTDATTVLGMRTMRTLVTTAALAGSFKAPACDGFDFPGFWHHAISAAVSARIIAAAIGADGETAFTAALLHDVGQLVFATNFPARFAQVLALQSSSEIALIEAERSLLGTDHAALGALLAERWHFPRGIVEAIGQHHAPPKLGNAAGLVHIVYVAGTLAHLVGLGQLDASAMPAACNEVWSGMDLSMQFWNEVAVQTDQQARAICTALVPAAK